MGLKVRLHKQARADLREIRDYLLEVADRRSADLVRLHLRQRILRLGDFPQLGTPTTMVDVRILAPTKYPYRIYYTLTDDAVVILHIRHTSRANPETGELV